MKRIPGLLFILLLFISAQVRHPDRPIDLQPAKHLFIITLDGLRWQEVYGGADPDILENDRFTPDSAAARLNFKGLDAAARREALMPFCWSVLAGKGQLHGNRYLKSYMNTANMYSFSYPGYNEIFTGNTDLAIASNKKRNNPHRNVLEHLNARPKYKDQVAAFTSWDVFPFILGQHTRKSLFINCGSRDLKGTRRDQLTFDSAMHYLQLKRPQIMFLGLGEMDEFAHARRYDQYLESIHQADQLIEKLWEWIQQDPEYRDQTNLLITTDHGRGRRDDKWYSHGALISGSSETWMGLLGPGIPPLGELRAHEQRYQQQLASMIAAMVGEEFGNGVAVK